MQPGQFNARAAKTSTHGRSGDSAAQGASALRYAVHENGNERTRPATVFASGIWKRPVTLSQPGSVAYPVASTGCGLILPRLAVRGPNHRAAGSRLRT
jgi:hypothetical protein